MTNPIVNCLILNLYGVTINIRMPLQDTFFLCTYSSHSS